MSGPPSQIAEDTPPTVDPIDTLTPREREVFVALAGGAFGREVAARLKISVKTVETHRGQVLKKLSLRNNAELALFAARRDLIHP